MTICVAGSAPNLIRPIPDLPILFLSHPDSLRALIHGGRSDIGRLVRSDSANWASEKTYVSALYTRCYVRGNKCALVYVLCGLYIILQKKKSERESDEHKLLYSHSEFFQLAPSS